MTATILPFDPSRWGPRRLAIPRVYARNVSCPYCDASPGRPCTNRGTEQARPEGPHRGRIAAAEAELERGHRA